MCIGVAAVVSQGRPANLRELTVPADHLPSGCALSPKPSVHLDGNRIRTGLWAGLPTNPWIGTDPLQIASIRELMDPPMLPDGPPLTPHDAALFRLRLADGIEEGYGAVYLPSGSNGALITVFALRFPSDDSAAELWRQAMHRTTRARSLFAIGSIVVLVFGENGACLQAVATYLESLSRSSPPRFRPL
jgi:hypothetical protein